MDNLSNKKFSTCPIHKWTDIEKYLSAAHVPDHLWEAFHELIQARGAFPKAMSDSQGKYFRRQAVQIVNKYNIGPLEANGLMIIFSQLIEQWLSTNARDN